MMSEEVVVVSLHIPSVVMPFREQLWLYNSLKNLKPVNEGKLNRIMPISITESEFNNSHPGCFKTQFYIVLHYQHMFIGTCKEFMNI